MGGLKMVYKDNGDGTLTDKSNGIMWQVEEDQREKTYTEALRHCQALDLGGYGDWRLPRKEELQQLARAGFDELKQVFPNLQKERYWAYSPGDELHWAENPGKIAYTVDFDPASSNYGKAITYFRTYSYFVRAVRNLRSTQRAVALRSLRSAVEPLASEHKHPVGALDLSGRTAQQIPWICRTLEEAASALETGKDPFGNPITEDQIMKGLNKLVEIVREPTYLTTMDIVFPGIAKPLERSMDTLEQIIRGRNKK